MQSLVKSRRTFYCWCSCMLCNPDYKYFHLLKGSKSAFAIHWQSVVHHHCHPSPQMQMHKCASWRVLTECTFTPLQARKRDQLPNSPNSPSLAITPHMNAHLCKSKGVDWMFFNLLQRRKQVITIHQPSASSCHCHPSPHTQIPNSLLPLPRSIP